MTELLSNDNLIKIGAAVAAAFLLFGPQIAKSGKSMLARLAEMKMPSLPSEDPAVTDMKSVLDLTYRLRMQGNDEAVAIAQELLDAMLAPKVSKK